MKICITGKELHLIRLLPYYTEGCRFEPRKFIVGAYSYKEKPFLYL